MDINIHLYPKLSAISPERKDPVIPPEVKERLLTANDLALELVLLDSIIIV